MTRSALILLTFASLMWAPMNVAHADRDSAKQSRRAKRKAKAAAIKIATQAKRDYLVGKFAVALATYRRAYEVYPAPGLLFNIGQCHSKLKHWSMAIFSYQAYLRERPKTRNRPVVMELIRDAQAALAKEQDAKAARNKRPDRKAQNARQRQLDAQRARQRTLVTPALVTQTPGAQPVASPFYKKWWFWTTVGVVATSGTIIFATSSTTTVLPERSLGILDRR